MELDVAALQRPRSVIPIGQRDAEHVIASRLAVIAHIHLIGPTPTVDVGCALDMACRSVNYAVRCNTSALDLWTTRAVVDIGEMAPKSAVLDPTCHTEGPSLTRWCPDDPSATGHEVPAWAGGPAAGDICVRRGNDDIRNPVDHDVQGVDSDVACVATHRTLLLVDDDATDRQRYRLIGLPRNDDRLSVHH